MNIKFEHGWMHLCKDRSLRLTDASGTQVVVRSGSLWVTQDRDRNDHVLEAGEAFKLDRAGDAILYALSASDIELVERLPEVPRANIAAKLLGAAASAAGNWIAGRFGAQGAANRNLRYWDNAV